mgnify:CR=1 FL=1
MCMKQKWQRRANADLPLRCIIRVSLSDCDCLSAQSRVYMNILNFGIFCDIMKMLIPIMGRT